MNEPLKKRWAYGLAAGIVLTVWYAVAWAIAPDREGGLVLLPMPHVVLIELRNLIVVDGFLVDIAHSVFRISLGVFLAAVPAFVLGFWFGVNAKVYSVGDPVFAFAKYIPPVSFVPILILWLGVGLTQQLALLFIGIFFYLTISAAKTVSDTPKAMLDAGRTLGLSHWKLIEKIRIPNALPELIQHLRQMVGIAWTYLVVVEMVAAESGIGRVIINNQRFLSTAKVLAGMLTIGLLGVISDRSLVLVSKLVCSWKEANVKN